jgi:CBS domain-containing protein
MLLLRDIMTRDVVTVAPELSVRDAMDLLTTRHISGAPVASTGRVIGVVSLTDLAEFAAGSPGVPTERPELADWGEWESSGDHSEEDEPPAAFFAEFWDDAGADVAERISETDGPEWNVLAEHVVSEVMNRRLCALAPDTPVDRAADAMRNAGIHRVLVMEGDALVGLVSTKDISDAVADRRLTSRVYGFGAPRSSVRRSST